MGVPWANQQDLKGNPDQHLDVIVELMHVDTSGYATVQLSHCHMSHPNYCALTCSSVYTVWYISKENRGKGVKNVKEGESRESWCRQTDLDGER